MSSQFMSFDEVVLAMVNQIHQSQEFPVTSYYEEPDTKDHVIQIATTGHDEQNIKITTENNVITITAKIPEEERNRMKSFRFFHRKIKIADIDRTFSVPDHLDIAALTAECKKGLLTLRLPLTAEYKKRLEKREVSINA